MKRSILFLILINLFSSLTAQYKVSGGNASPLLATQTGITEVYLLYGLSGAQISFTSSSSGTHQWYRYTESIDDAIPVPCTQNGNTSVITDINGGYGYYVASPLGTGYIWIIDYSRYIPNISGLKVMEDEYVCKELKLIADINMMPVYYYVSGRRYTLSRKFSLTYNNLTWDDEEKMFIQGEVKLTLDENTISPEITVYTPPLMNTTFTLIDSFSAHFGIAQTISSGEYQAVAVEAHGFAETDKEHAENELHNTGDALGGSAPIEYTFTAYANEPVAAFYTWKISKLDSLTLEMKPIVWYKNEVLRYNFDKEGFYSVELEVIDRRSVCVDITQSFKVVINNTVIKIPNAFSPGTSIGVNDELRISFSSITSFKASVYNRQGNLLYQWSDPTKGWDGRVHGKFVPTGVYYVIVEYKDSLGKSRSMSKAVNILRAINKPNETE